MKPASPKKISKEALPSADSIHLHYSDCVLTVIFDHKPTRNSFNQERANSFLTILKGLHKGNQPLWNGEPVGVLALESAVPGIFVSGGDLSEIKGTPSSAAKTMAMMRQATELLATLPCLSVVYLSGQAIGGGAELALACDERWICSKEASIELRQRDWGLPSGWNGLHNLLRIRPAGGIRRALLDFTLGRNWLADDLLAEGMAQQDFRKTSLEMHKAFAIKHAERICGCPRKLRMALLRDFPRKSSPSNATSLFDRFWFAEEHIAALKSYENSLQQRKPTKEALPPSHRRS